MMLFAMIGASASDSVSAVSWAWNFWGARFE